MVKWRVGLSDHLHFWEQTLNSSRFVNSHVLFACERALFFFKPSIKSIHRTAEVAFVNRKLSPTPWRDLSEGFQMFKFDFKKKVLFYVNKTTLALQRSTVTGEDDRFPSTGASSLIPLMSWHPHRRHQPSAPSPAFPRWPPPHITPQLLISRSRR